MLGLSNMSVLDKICTLVRSSSSSFFVETLVAAEKKDKMLQSIYSLAESLCRL
jgi:hypothetical protein